MTVAKSKYYMLKVNYPQIFDQIEADSIQGRDEIDNELRPEDKVAETQQEVMNDSTKSET